MTIKHLHLRDLLFFVSIMGLAILSFLVIKPFIAILIIAVILVEILSPINKFLEKKLKRRALAASLSTLLAFILILLPAVLIALIGFNQAIEIKGTVQAFIENTRLFEADSTYIAEKVNAFFGLFGVHVALGPINYENFAQGVVGELSTVATSALNILKNIIAVIFGFVFLFYTMFHLFKEYGNLRQAFYDFSPLDKELDEIFIDKFLSTSKSVFKGNFIVGLVVGAVGTIGLIIAGVDAPIFWGLIITALSIVPLGAVFVWLPASIILYANGHTVSAIFLFVWGILLVGLIDDFIRPILLKKKTNIHPLILFFGIVGGIETFGIVGLIYGPLIIVLFLSLLAVYRHKYKNL